jgi:hypothetical protein
MGTAHWGAWVEGDRHHHRAPQLDRGKSVKRGQWKPPTWFGHGCHSSLWDATGWSKRQWGDVARKRVNSAMSQVPDFAVIVSRFFVLTFPIVCPAVARAWQAEAMTKALATIGCKQGGGGAG